MISMPDDYTVRLVDMPVTQRGMISESPDGHINFYINARLSATGQMGAAYHEWKHWLNDDLNNSDDIKTVEQRAGSKLDRIKGHIFRARDLLPPVAPKTAAKLPLTQHEAAVLFRCVNELDRFAFAGFDRQVE